ncbi:MAG: hypothetical protein ACREJ1_12685 [Candidatus Methylomirabilales bacterium]
MTTLRGNPHAALRAVLLAAIGLSVVACASKGSAPPAPAPSTTRVDSPPEWRAGDRWVYDWTSGTNAGTKTVEVLEIKGVNNIQYYIVRIGDLDHYYTLDFKWAGTVRDGRVEARMAPPQPWFAWPLEIGKRWVHRGSYEERDRKQEQNDTFAVVTTETVEVPAGRFHAFKVVREASRLESDQYWYAPEVRWYAKWIGRRGQVQFEERLREYQAAPRLIPAPTPASPPSKPK